MNVEKALEFLKKTGIPEPFEEVPLEKIISMQLFEKVAYDTIQKNLMDEMENRYNTVLEDLITIPYPYKYFILREVAFNSYKLTKERFPIVNQERMKEFIKKDLKRIKKENKTENSNDNEDETKIRYANFKGYEDDEDCNEDSNEDMIQIKYEKNKKPNEKKKIKLIRRNNIEKITEFQN